MPKPAIKLMPDYQCWPLWHHGGDRIGNIDPRELSITDTLANDLERWAEIFESHLNWSDPGSTKWTEEETAHFDAEGRRLCVALAREVGQDFAVFYFDPKSGLCIPVEALSSDDNPL